MWLRVEPNMYDRQPCLSRRHSSGTYDKMMNDGGSSGGTIRFKQELMHGGNAGLAKVARRGRVVSRRYPSVGSLARDHDALGV